jgi:hypothetical protein
MSNKSKKNAQHYVCEGKYYLAVNSITSAYKSENETDYSDFQKLAAGHLFFRNFTNYK